MAFPSTVASGFHTGWETIVTTPGSRTSALPADSVLTILFAVREDHDATYSPNVCPLPTDVVSGTVISGSLTFEGVIVAAVWYPVPFQYLTTAS
jgi:hypothetical protein